MDKLGLHLVSTLPQLVHLLDSESTACISGHVARRFTFDQSLGLSDNLLIETGNIPQEIMVGQLVPLDILPAHINHSIVIGLGGYVFRYTSRTADLGALHRRRPTEIYTTKICVRQIRIVQIGAGHIRMFKMRSSQVTLSEIGVPQIRALKL